MTRDPPYGKERAVRILLECILVANFWPHKKVKGEIRVATAQGKQGKQGIWFLLFPDRENTGNFALTQGKILRHRENIFL